MKTERKGLSKKVRFEVFKRDSFTCQYCGSEPPKVVLHVDHIKPVAKGGKNDMLNLITACSECNQGKSAVELSDDTAIEKQKKLLNELNEKREQLEMLLKWREGLTDLKKSQVEAVSDYFKKNTGFGLNKTGKLEVSKILKKHSLSEVLNAMDESFVYLKTDDNGAVTNESIQTAWIKIPGILRVSKMPFYMKDLFYIRGICRNRFNYCDDVKALSLLKNAYLSLQNDFSHEETIHRLKGFVCEAKNWTQFNSELIRF